nr:MAG TPA: hypothetical protein [Caudoviricetes sp.]
MTLTKRDYIDYANQIAIKEGLDPTIFIAQLNQESGFNPKAKNPKSGAIGIAQFMPSTAKGMGFTAGVNPLRDIRMAAQYMKSKLKMYNGDYRLALASYNAGSGNVAKYGGVPPFKETQNYVNRIMSMAGKNDVLTGGVEKQGFQTGAASNLNIPDPERPNYQPYMTSQNTVAIDNGEGLPPMRITGDELGAINAITAPIVAPQDVRPDVIVGQDKDGKPITVTASQYNQMLNEMDAQKIQQLNQDLQANLPNLAKAEIQLGGKNAYDTLLGLRNEYNNAIANDPRWDLVRLTPEQAQDAMNILSAKQGAGTSGIVDKAKYYQMMNALQNYQTPMDNAYDLTNQEYLAQLGNMKQFQQDALTLAQGNQALAQELMKQAVAGNGNVINAIQKTQEKRLEKEADYQKQIQSDYGTLLNTQRQGLNTVFTGIPKLRQDQNQYVNSYNLDRFGTDVKKYGTDVGAQKDLIMPQVEADVEARNPIVRAKLDIEQQRANAASQNANTAEAAAATNAILNSAYNSAGLNIGAETVPSLNTVLGSPTKKTRDALFGGGVLPNNNKTIDYFSMFNND